MPLLDFYTVLEKAITEAGHVKYVIQLDPEHLIFEGHFPQHPILPGVAMLQLLKELAEQQLNIELQLQRATNVKFFSHLFCDTQHLENTICHNGLRFLC